MICVYLLQSLSFLLLFFTLRRKIALHKVLPSAMLIRTVYIRYRSYHYYMRPSKGAVQSSDLSIAVICICIYSILSKFSSPLPCTKLLRHPSTREKELQHVAATSLSMVYNAIKAAQPITAHVVLVCVRVSIMYDLVIGTMGVSQI